MKEIYNMLMSEDDSMFKTGLILLFSSSEEEFKEVLNYIPEKNFYHSFIPRRSNYAIIFDSRLTKRENAWKIRIFLQKSDLFKEVISVL